MTEQLHRFRIRYVLKDIKTREKTAAKETIIEAPFGEAALCKLFDQLKDDKRYVLDLDSPFNYHEIPELA